MNTLKAFLGVGFLLAMVQPPSFSQLRDFYAEQQQMRQRNATQLQDAINLICKHGQFIAPAFGASSARHIYLIDRKQNIYRYTDDAVAGVRYSDSGYSDSTLSTALTCKPSSGFIVSLPYARLGKLGSSVSCEGKNYSCEYSIEDLGLYVYKKPRNSSTVSRIFLANRRNQIEVGKSGTYRRCDGYFGSPAELRICFGKQK
jgi:hypothetical protein